MTRAELLDLAARVEAAEGADRELDVEIYRALSHRVEWRPVNLIMELRPIIDWQEPHPHAGMKEPCPAPTSSLDAAASLASPWLIAALGDMVADGLPGAVLLLSTAPVKHATGIGYGTRESGCLARALTAAALRAIAEEAGDG